MTTKLAMLFGVSSPLKNAAIPTVGDSFSPLLVGVLAAVVLIALILIIVALRKSKAQDKAEVDAPQQRVSNVDATRQNASDDAPEKRGKHVR